MFSFLKNFIGSILRFDMKKQQSDGGSNQIMGDNNSLTIVSPNEFAPQFVCTETHDKLLKLSKEHDGLLYSETFSGDILQAGNDIDLSSEDNIDAFRDLIDNEFLYSYPPYLPTYKGRERIKELLKK